MVQYIDFYEITNFRFPGNFIFKEEHPSDAADTVEGDEGGGESGGGEDDGVDTVAGGSEGTVSGVRDSRSRSTTGWKRGVGGI
jgi:hypothetical protein